MKEKQVLLFGFEEELEQIITQLEKQNIKSVIVAPEQGKETIGYLCAMKGFSSCKKLTEEKPAGRLMVFHNIPREELDAILDGLKKAKLGAGSLKAMVTPTNARWSIGNLLGEVREEQQVVGALMELKHLCDQAPAPDPANLPLMTALMQSQLLLSGTREVSLQDVEKAKQMLLKVMK